MENSRTLGIAIENVGEILNSVNFTHGSLERFFGKMNFSCGGRVAVRVIPHEPRNALRVTWFRTRVCHFFYRLFWGIPDVYWGVFS